VLFLTEMWEKFSFFGMRALQVYYMTKALHFSQGTASLIYGACQQLGLQALEAETDGDAVEFFRAIGFDVESRTGRSRCRLELSEGWALGAVTARPR